MKKKLYLLFMAGHVWIYSATKGKIGGKMGGMEILLLTTVGRKTRMKRTRPVAFFRDDENYIVVASAGGAPNNPSWYLNLEARPKVEVQVAGEVFTATAKTASPKKRDELWKKIVEAAPSFGIYAKKTKRIIPVVILTPKR